MRKLLWTSLALLAMSAVSGCAVDDTYAVCNVTADCNDVDDECWPMTIVGISEGNFCSHPCDDDFDCESAFGFPGVCWPGGSIPLCHQTCVDDLDCFASSICVEAEFPGGFFERICVPDN